MELVEIARSLTLPWEEVLIMPVGDVHLGDSGADMDMLRRHINWGIEHGAYFVGMGDYIDVASPSNRDRLRGAELYDSVISALEARTEQLVNEFCGVAREGRWLGMLEGHHYFTFEDGTTSDTRICERLHTSFLGTCAFVRLKFVKDRKERTCTLWLHHGVGGGLTAGTPLNRLERIANHFDADVYLVGHHHKKVATPLDTLYMTKGTPPKIAHRVRVLACTGSFHRAYMQGHQRGGIPRGDYVEREMLPPAQLGGVVLRIRPVREGNSTRLSITVEL